MPVLWTSLSDILFLEHCCYCLQFNGSIALWYYLCHCAHMDAGHISFACFGRHCWEKQQKWVPGSLPHHQIPERGSTTCLVPENHSTDGDGRFSSFQCHLHWAVLHLCKHLGTQDLHNLQHSVYSLYHPPYCHSLHYCCSDLLSAYCWRPRVVVEVCILSPSTVVLAGLHMISILASKQSCLHLKKKTELSSSLDITVIVCFLPIGCLSGVQEAIPCYALQVLMHLILSFFFLWCRSFLCGGSTGFFVFAYCLYYYRERSDMSGFMQTSFFFGYMACICYAFFLMLGMVGFRAALLFVRHIYKSIKCE